MKSSILQRKEPQVRKGHKTFRFTLMISYNRIESITKRPPKKQIKEINLETCKLCSIIILRLLFCKSEFHVSNILKFLKYPFLWRILTQQIKVLIDITNNIEDLGGEGKTIKLY
jgi:hypothetical protein